MTCTEFDNSVVHPDIAKNSVNKEGDKTSEEETKRFESKDQTSSKAQEKRQLDGSRDRDGCHCNNMQYPVL
eukprot:5410604-Ditylum_brightwellii.AAC.1